MESLFAIRSKVSIAREEAKIRHVLNERDADPLRARLQRRVHDCWERLDDVVSELVELHGVPVDEVVERVREAAADEDVSAAS